MEYLPQLDMNYSKRAGAVFTHVNNEDKFFPIWLKHYSQYYDSKDIYVINHNSTGEFLEVLKEGARKEKFTMITVYNDQWFNGVWQCYNFSLFQWFLLQSYNTVLASDVDEIVTVDPKSRYKDLREYYEKFVGHTIATQGYHIVSDPLNDPPIDVSRPILEQRNRMVYDGFLHKPLLSRIKCQYNFGQHNTNNVSYDIDKSLLMLHLHYIDVEWTIEKDNKRSRDRWSEFDIANGFSIQNLPCDREEKIKMFQDVYAKSEEMPYYYEGLI